MDILVRFLKKKIRNGIFDPKYEKSSVIKVDMCTKPCLYTTTTQINNWTIGFRLYSSSDGKDHQIMNLNEF